jgi:hypothetical protein
LSFCKYAHTAHTAWACDAAATKSKMNCAAGPRAVVAAVATVWDATSHPAATNTARRWATGNDRALSISTTAKADGKEMVMVWAAYAATTASTVTPAAAALAAASTPGGRSATGVASRCTCSASTAACDCLRAQANPAEDRNVSFVESVHNIKAT